jgi:hypothetical protein
MNQKAAQVLTDISLNTSQTCSINHRVRAIRTTKTRAFWLGNSRTIPTSSCNNLHQQITCKKHQILDAEDKLEPEYRYNNSKMEPWLVAGAWELSQNKGTGEGIKAVHQVRRLKSRTINRAPQLEKQHLLRAGQRTTNLTAQNQDSRAPESRNKNRADRAGLQKLPRHEMRTGRRALLARGRKTLHQNQSKRLNDYYAPMA